MLKKVLFLALLVFLFRSPGFSQPMTNLGTDFWVAFHPTDPAMYLIVIITSDYACSGTITSSYNSYSKDFTVVPGIATKDTLPNYLILYGAGLSNKAVHITTTAPVSVVVFDDCNLPLSADTYLALPTDVLGTEYFVMSMYSDVTAGATMFSVLATEDGTTVNIYNKATGQNEVVQMNKGEAYIVEGTLNTEVTGSRVQSDHPVAVFGSNGLSCIPPGCIACDHIIEEMPPTRAWGMEFYTVSTGGRELDGDLFRIMAKDNFTSVKINGTEVATLNWGNYYETELKGMNVIETSNPVLVSQYAKGYDCAGTTSLGDPFMMLVPPRQQAANRFLVHAIDWYLDFINIVASPNAYGNIYLDGNLIPTSQFSEIGNSGYYGARLNVTDGVLHILTSDDPFQVYSYGWIHAISYGHPAGGSISDLASVAFITLTPDTAYGVLNFTNMCFTATVQNNTLAPIPGIMVDFKLDGMGPILKSLFTDSLGQAHFCYTRTGTVPGKDSIYAEILNLRSTVSWGIWDVCKQPTSGGVVGYSQSDCSGFVPDPIVDLYDPGGYNGELEYRWQQSTTDSVTGFADIPGANSPGYSPGFIDITTWFRRLTKVTCDSTWPSNGISNVVEMAVSQLFTPAVTITPSTNPYCMNVPVTIIASGMYGGSDPSFQWFLNGNPVGSDTSEYTWMPSPGDSIWCVFTSSLSCVSINPVTSLKVIMQPDLSNPAGISISASNNPFCTGDSVTLTATPQNGGTNPVYEWHVNGQVTGTGNPVFTFIPHDNDIVECLLTSDLPCVSNNPVLSDTVRMRESIVEANFSVTPDETTLDQPLIIFTDQSTGAVDCFIDWGDGVYTSCDSAQHIYTSAGTFTIKELVISIAGCSDSAFNQVVIRTQSEYSLSIPNAFTPDGDGLNDIFRINVTDVSDFILWIFARNGEMIFTGKDPAAGWDGTSKGALCPEGVYAYRIKFTDLITGLKYDYSGHVLLLKQKK